MRGSKAAFGGWLSADPLLPIIVAKPLRLKEFEIVNVQKISKLIPKFPPLNITLTQRQFEIDYRRYKLFLDTVKLIKTGVVDGCVKTITNKAINDTPRRFKPNGNAPRRVKKVFQPVTQTATNTNQVGGAHQGGGFQPSPQDNIKNSRRMSSNELLARFKKKN